MFLSLSTFFSPTLAIRHVSVHQLIELSNGLYAHFQLALSTAHLLCISLPQTLSLFSANSNILIPKNIPLCIWCPLAGCHRKKIQIKLMTDHQFAYTLRCSIFIHIKRGDKMENDKWSCFDHDTLNTHSRTLTRSLPLYVTLWALRYSNYAILHSRVIRKYVAQWKYWFRSATVRKDLRENCSIHF